MGAKHQWLTTGILVIQEAEIGRIMVQVQPRQKLRHYLKNTQHTKKGLLQWLKW
jgi:hypothetical protein